jgi:hypothetical protein
MAVREYIQRKPAVAASISLAVVVLAAVFVYFQTMGTDHSRARLLNSEFYSDDDGKTWFIDDASKLPPFEHEGKMAVQAAVYRYDDGKRFVAYLEKFSDAQRSEIEAAIAAHPDEAPHWRQSPMEAKKPGDSKWVPPGGVGSPALAKAYQRVTTPVSPDGSTTVSPVAPTDADAVNQ